MAQEKTITALLGGSFNPVHTGHLMVASYIRQFTKVDEVWMLLSPLNPLKDDPSALLPDLTRLKMLELATEDVDGVEVSDIELSMPRPSYTINTLRFLSRRYPRRSFKLIIGSDNWKNFNKWRNYQEIIDNYGVIIYPRPGYELPPIYDDGVDVVNAPTCDLSSTWIRSAIARGKNLNIFLPEKVNDYIRENGLYQKKQSE
ncbi:MAG: nicotinate (nicotinamide) nucleotide adenylyltransferase [Lachnoclostridium sp.]|nr:nicotinate (nicotinamide) nucleotide adenylyltransferase [Lachnoclostridium sp.]